jgi:hypothetical protein
VAEQLTQHQLVCSSTKIALTATGYKRSWRWLWRKRLVVTVLAEKPHALQVSDHVAIHTLGEGYVVRVNNEPVLRWPDA